MDEIKLSAYHEALDDLRKAVQELKKHPADWRAADQRVAEAEKKCEDARLALFRRRN